MCYARLQMALPPNLHLSGLVTCSHTRNQHAGTVQGYSLLCDLPPPTPPQNCSAAFCLSVSKQCGCVVQGYSLLCDLPPPIPPQNCSAVFCFSVSKQHGCVVQGYEAVQLLHAALGSPSMPQVAPTPPPTRGVKTFQKAKSLLSFRHQGSSASAAASFAAGNSMLSPVQPLPNQGKPSFS